MHQTTRHQEIRRTLIITLVANIIVAVAKLVVGLITGALAMVADAFHSLLDGTSNLIGLGGNILSARPPDEDHPYGHRRFETLASLIIGGLLLLTAWEITRSAVERLVSGATAEVGFSNFATMLVTLGINIGVAVYERRAGQHLKSEFLLADALHTQSDIFVSITVIISLLATQAGLGWADPVAALLVVAFIGYAAWQIMKPAASILVDKSAVDPDVVGQIAENVAGIQKVTRVRSRGPEDEIHIDLDAQIAGPTTIEHSNAMAQEIRKRLRDKLDGVNDIQVHFSPEQGNQPDYMLVARAEADALGMGVHEVIATSDERGLMLEMHLEVAPEQTVGEAHRLVTVYEERIKQVIPNLARIVTHIEPAYDGVGRTSHTQLAHRLAHDAVAIAKQLYPKNQWHDVDIRAESDGGYAISMHCHVAADMPLEAAHNLAEVVETHVRSALPLVHRVTIHTEPPE